MLTIRARLRSSPLRIGYLRPAVPTELRELVERCLAREPAERPEPAELERHLRTPVGELPSEDAANGPPDATTIADATTQWVQETAGGPGAS